MNWLTGEYQQYNNPVYNDIKFRFEIKYKVNKFMPVIYNLLVFPQFFYHPEVFTTVLHGPLCEI